MKNNITIIGLNFFPEDTAIGLYSTQMAQHIKNLGYEVNIITGFPYYPQWKIYKEYSQKQKFLKEEFEGLNIYRYKQYVSRAPSFFKRMLHMLDFTLGSFINIFKIKKTDLIICVVPFTTSILLGKALSILTKAPIWVHVQDFEFDAAMQTGIFSNNKYIRSTFFKVLFYFEKKLFSTSKIASTISNSMILKLKQKTKKETFFFPNWIDEDVISPALAEPHSYFNKNKFNILYSGNIGDKQDWLFFIEYAKKLNDFNNINITVVGSGAKQHELEKIIAPLSNVNLFPPVPYKELCNLLCSADLHILFQKEEVFDTVMPSKLLGMMVSQKPSIITGNIKSEVAIVLQQSEGGYYFSSNNIDSVIETTINLMRDKIKSHKIGCNARKYVVEMYSKKRVLTLFEKKLANILK